jgi:hypothetical protein
METYRTLLSRHAAARRGSSFYHRLLSWGDQQLDVGAAENQMRLTRIHCIRPSTHPCGVNAYMLRRPIAHLPMHGCNVSRFTAQTARGSELTNAPPPVSPVPPDETPYNSSFPVAPEVQIPVNPSPSPRHIDICPR